VRSRAKATFARPRLSRRVGLTLALAIALLAGVVWLGSLWREWLAARAAFPRVSGILQLHGLDAPVQIDRDARGVPHVRGESERDAFFALGFVHAQDRLAQMLWLERLARGRTAEVIGPRGLPADRDARLIGFGRLADAQMAFLAPETAAVLEAYAAGVNAWIEQIERGAVGAPLVVRLLEIPLETWEAADSLAVFKAFAWGLGNSVDASLVLHDVIQELGAGAARPFFPRRGPASPPAPQTTARAAEAQRPRAPDPLREALGLLGPSVGSSAWVVAGAHTASGRPILVADAHLAPTVPALLHLDHVRAGDLDVAGMTLPGVPVFWTGRNPHVAWASVHARAVVTDLFAETLHPRDSARHHDGRSWRDVSERVELLRVRGGEAEELRVVETRHGPLLPEREGRDPLSVAWTGARVDGPSGIGSLLGVARAVDAEGLIDALRRHHEPVLAVVYADAQGQAGMHVAGWIPRRSLSPGLLPLPGRARWYDWTEPVAFDALPQQRLSEGDDWIVVADAALPEPSGGEPIEWLWRSGERTARIERLLGDAIASGPMDLRSLVALQSDVGGERARSLIEAALALLESEPEERLAPETEEIIEILRAWDGRSLADSVGAAVYHEFLTALTDGLLQPRLGEALLQRYLALPQADAEQVVFELVRGAALDETPLHWQDRAAVARGVRDSLHQAWLRISFQLGPNRERWTWGRLHALRFEPFGGLGDVLGNAAGIGSYPYAGSRNTVSAAAYLASDPFRVRIASTARFGVDSAALDQALASLAPGESEHVGHGNYRDGIDTWLAGRSSLLVTDRLLVEESSLARLVLEPVR